MKLEAFLPMITRLRVFINKFSKIFPRHFIKGGWYCSLSAWHRG
jgi:hypothetical protein